VVGVLGQAEERGHESGGSVGLVVHSCYSKFYEIMGGGKIPGKAVGAASCLLHVFGWDLQGGVH